jgi:hypothetical protein
MTARRENLVQEGKGGIRLVDALQLERTPQGQLGLVEERRHGESRMVFNRTTPPATDLTAVYYSLILPVESASLAAAFDKRY